MHLPLLMLLRLHCLSSFLVSVSAVSRSNLFVISDYFRDNPSFASYRYESTSHVVHDIRVDVDLAKFQWVLLGQERDCKIQIDNSPKLKSIITLHGYSTKFSPLPKKQYEILVTTNDRVKHNLVLRHSYLDPSFTREKLVHDGTYVAGGVSPTVTHVNLYMNGEHNGLYQVVESINSEMIKKRYVPSTDLWYYIQRTFSISVRKQRGTVASTSTNEILRLNPDRMSQTEFDLFDPLYQASNTSKAVSDIFNYSSYAASMISRRAFAATDIYLHNFFMVVDPDSKKLQTLMWDLDKVLGIGVREGTSITYTSNPQDVLLLVDRWHYFRKDIFINTDYILELPHSQSFQSGIVSEFEGYKRTALLLLEDGGAYSESSMNLVLDELYEALAASAGKDQDKWSRWYCKERMNFPEAISELRTLILDLLYNYKQVLLDQPNQRRAGNFHDSYYCQDYLLGKGDEGMFALLWTLFAVNVAAFLFPVGTLSLVVSKLSGAVSDSKKPVEGEPQDWNMSLKQYGTGCLERFTSYDYGLNTLVAAVTIALYIVYARYDVLDDSEIFGKEYMADIKYIWIYFVVAINVSFLFSDNFIRLCCWLVIVLTSNIYSIIDLILFVGAESDTHQVSSRGISISFNIERRYRVVFFCFVVWRIACQLIIMLYTFRIVEISRAVSLDIEKNDSTIRKPQLIDPDVVLDNNIEMTGLDSNDEELGSIDAMDKTVNNYDLIDIVLGDGDGDATTEPTGGDNFTTTTTKPSKPAPLRGDALTAYKLKMKRFMWINMAVFVFICAGYVIYLGVEGTLRETAAEIFFSTTISVAILINIRAFYSCIKWFWLHAYGFDTATLDVVYGNRNDDSKWSLDKLTKVDLVSRDSPFSFLLFGKELSTEIKIRTVDGWTKKITHTYDGLLVFIVSSQSFAEDENSSQAYSLAYAISLIYMLLYVVSYNGEGALAWIVYGAKARVMDGFLARENEIFGFMFDKYMLPVSAPLLLWLKSSSEDNEILFLSWYIFMPIIVGDSFAEVVGSTWGKQRIKVWGMGEINKKSWEGTIAMFLSSFLIMVGVNITYSLSWQWYLFAAGTSFVATIVELYAYRSTDNVCMLIFGALLSVLFVQVKRDD